MRKGIFLVLMLSLAIAAFLSPLASSKPDGLERVAEDKGFIHLSKGQEVVKAPMADYAVSGIKNTSVSGGLAGVAGTLITFGTMYGIGKLYMKSRRVTDR